MANRRLFIGVFETEGDLLAVTRAARDQGLRIVDAYTPYPVHGLDQAMGLAPSRLSRACLVGGLLGAALAMWFQYWTMSIDWPINVGGRPWNSWPAFVPVAFETMVLLAGFGVAFAFFIVSRLYPGKKAVLPITDPTASRFVLVVEETDAAFDPVKVRQLFQQHHAFTTEEREEQADTGVMTTPAPRSITRWNVILLIILLTLAGLNWIAYDQPSRPHLEFMPEMARSIPFDTYAANANFPDGQTLQEPIAGTIPRGFLPMHYRATPEDAIRAGHELVNPFTAKDAEALKRGAFIFAQYCAVCHGPKGMGDGPVTQRGVPPPPSFLAEKATTMKDGQMFHVLTYGQANMASYAGLLSRDDRWKAVLQVRALQKQAGGKP